jgi:1-acyl-sn-glycerol-3-phosphate acyltransferase
MLSFFQKLLTAPPQTREELKPSPETLALVTQKYQRLRPVGGLFLRRWGTFTASGLEHIPREGPVIILTNHVAHFDALHINYMVRRPVIFLASTALFSGDMRSRFLQSMGMIPKRKFTPDARAIRTLRGWIDSGAAVGIFPEGERSWDGEPLPMVPGIAKLIRFLDAPVVTGRIHNGDHHWPRWSPHHRRTRVHLELDEAVTFGRRTPPDDITRYISQRIVIPPDQHRRWPARGSRQLCEGLSNLLFCCPACQTPEALTEQGAQLSCSACAAAWRLDTSGVLTGIRGGAADTTIAEQRARLQTGFPIPSAWSARASCWRAAPASCSIRAAQSPSRSPAGGCG